MTSFKVFASSNLSYDTVRTYLVDADTLALHHQNQNQTKTDFLLPTRPAKFTSSDSLLLRKIFSIYVFFTV